MENFSFDAIRGRNRVSAWNALYSNQLNKVEFTPADRNGFNASLTMGRLGPVQFARINSDRSNIERTKHHIVPGAPRLYSFLMQEKGSSTLYHCGQEAKLNQGDFVLCDSGAPHTFAINDDSEVIMLRVGSDTMKDHLPSPEQFCGHHLGSAVGLTSTMSVMVKKLQAQIEGGFTSVYDNRLAYHILEMLSMSYAIGFDERPDVSAVLKGRQADVIRYIEENLRDPDLSPSSIAKGLKISPRYLRTIFSSTGEKLSSYIMRRRLEECAKQLRDHKWAGHTITEIAFNWGFNSPAHFTRRFSQQFGKAPRDYRCNALG